MSREDILRAVKTNKPAPSPLPDLPHFPRPEGAMHKLFREAAEGVGASVVEIEILPGEATDWAKLQTEILKRYPGMDTIAHQIPSLDLPSLNWKELKDPHQLADVELCIIPGSFGVGENAAIWISEEVLAQRVLPFITQHLVILLPKSELVWNMHEAYQRLGSEMQGFGLFLSGPSKTADIEQSLVLGAHGARSLLIILH